MTSEVFETRMGFEKVGIREDEMEKIHSFVGSKVMPVGPDLSEISKFQNQTFQLGDLDLKTKVSSRILKVKRENSHQTFRNWSRVSQFSYRC